jgi:hypothetical protein
LSSKTRFKKNKICLISHFCVLFNKTACIQAGRGGMRIGEGNLNVWTEPSPVAIGQPRVSYDWNWGRTWASCCLDYRATVLYARLPSPSMPTSVRLFSSIRLCDRNGSSFENVMYIRCTSNSVQYDILVQDLRSSQWLLEDIRLMWNPLYVFVLHDCLFFSMVLA